MRGISLEKTRVLRGQMPTFAPRQTLPLRAIVVHESGGHLKMAVNRDGTGPLRASRGRAQHLLICSHDFSG